ncbi:Sugar or nucleoside kinase [Pseudomonas syringae pv. actinidiae]|uniref:Sugar or nucleoside kinase n=1 Tax=Pseudomonas syringae pv. actinidiae TaxID=103796 RepID=A0A2V0QAI4_PSESF|nr:Sugar or nucleoside kinase [Pseudomonas syringae pv. actinidiae]
MGCAAALKPATSVVSDEPSRPVLLPVPGSSRASLLLRPQARIKGGRVSIWPTTELLPGGRGSELARDGLRSGPETGHLGCV